MKQKSRIRKILMLLVLSFMMVGVWPAREAQAATDEAKAKVRETIIEVFRTGDTSTKNIHDLKLTWEEFDAIYNEVVENECWLEYRCCYNTIYQTTTYKENRIKYVTDFYMWGMDSRLPEHTAAVKEKIAYIQSQIDSKMTDLDKLVLIHDYIDRITTYDLNAEHGYIHSAVGPLCYGSSVCDGYAKAMNLLLNVVGIETDTVSNDGHEWSLVKIDGEYYHVDPTWDDTRCYKTGTYKTHYFMMRNDDEYRNDPYSPHTGFGYYDYVNNVDVTTFSTSTKYTDWYVHSVIGDMYYYDGYWYYVQDGSIVKNKISKTADTCETVVNGTGITLVGITDGVLSYKENSVEKTISLSTDAESGSETEGNTDTENGSETGGNTDTENGSETGEKTDTESGDTTGGTEDSGTEDNKDSESGGTTGGTEDSGTEDNKDNESGDTTGGIEDSGTEDNKDNESGGTTGGTEDNKDNESGDTTGGIEDSETEDNKESENGDATGENKDSGNKDIISGNTIGGNANTESGNTTENGNKNTTETENTGGDETGDTNNTQFVFKDKKSKGYYQVLTKGKKTGTVVYVKPYASAKGKVTIPATVKKDGITYKVIGISANAFKNNKKITQIVIGKNVKTIGAKAFYNCKKLKTIKINTTKLTSSSVKKTAFKGISKKVTVEVEKSKYSKYKKLLASKGLKSKSQVQKK